MAKLYYDSTVSTLNKDFENYPAIKTRQEVLTEFVKHLRTIEWQDSLMVMAKMDSVELMTHIQAVLESQKKTEEKTSKRKRRNRVDISQVSTSFTTTTSIQGTDWYFGNPSAQALGQQEFKRIWGNIPLEDNWRRSSRGVPMAQRPTTIIPTTSEDKATEEISTEPESIDPVMSEFNRIKKKYLLPMSKLKSR